MLVDQFWGHLAIVPNRYCSFCKLHTPNILEHIRSRCLKLYLTAVLSFGNALFTPPAGWSFTLDDPRCTPCNPRVTTVVHIPDASLLGWFSSCRWSHHLLLWSPVCWPPAPTWQPPNADHHHPSADHHLQKPLFIAHSPRKGTEILVLARQHFFLGSYIRLL